MRVEFYKTTWGMGGTLEQKLDEIAAAGYEGWEDWIRPHFEIRPPTEARGLKYMAMVQGVEDMERFRRDLGEAEDAGAVGVTIHAGSCFWSMDRARAFFENALRKCAEVSIPVNFETHRGRLLYEPMSTAALLQEFPDLHLVADFSHWTVVTGTMLEAVPAEVAAAIDRTRHVHARVGHTEGPQVPDPRAAQWQGQVNRHMEWWDKILAAHKARGAEVMTVDPEFGPPNYMWTNPADGQPLASLWDVSAWMRDQLKARWKDA
jgi:sugar phosphate isomerase/epimerase